MTVRSLTSICVRQVANSRSRTTLHNSLVPDSGTFLSGFLCALTNEAGRQNIMEELRDEFGPLIGESDMRQLRIVLGPKAFPIVCTTNSLAMAHAQRTVKAPSVCLQLDLMTSLIDITVVVGATGQGFNRAAKQRLSFSLTKSGSVLDWFE